MLVKDGQPQDAVWACTEALALQPNNVKALYRRAMAHGALNSGADLEAAVSDLSKAARISPSNKEARGVVLWLWCGGFFGGVRTCCASAKL